LAIGVLVKNFLLIGVAETLQPMKGFFYFRSRSVTHGLRKCQFPVWVTKPLFKSRIASPRIKGLLLPSACCSNCRNFTRTKPSGLLRPLPRRLPANCSKVGCTAEFGKFAPAAATIKSVPLSNTTGTYRAPSTFKRGL